MKLADRIRQIALVGGVESLGVLLSGLAGLLIVNLLPKDDYAVYTFFLACMTLMSGIGEMGLAHCVLPVVGQRARDPHWVMGVCRQVFKRRWMLLALGMVIVLPYGLINAQQHGWVVPAYGVAALLVLAAVVLGLRDNFLHTIFLVLGHVGTLNRAALAMHATRFLLVATVLFLPLGAATVAALFCATCASLVVSIVLQQRGLKTHAIEDWRLTREEQRHVDREALRIALPLLPSTAFYHVQGQITVLIVALVGTASLLAEVGALGRLAMVLVVLDRVSNMLLFPAIARAPTGPGLVRLVLRAHAAYLLLMLLIFVTALVWPQAWMLLLGPQYADQAPYLWMAVGAFVLINASGFAFRTLAGRGATTRQWITIPLVIVVQVLYVLLAGIHTLPQVLAFNLVTNFIHFAYQYTLLLGRLPTWREAAA